MNDTEKHSSDYRKSISSVAWKAVDYLQKRREGKIRPLRTYWETFNNRVGGFEPGTVTLVAAQSGGGKTALQNLLEHSIFYYKGNEGIDMYALTFNFEMPDVNLLVRKFSSFMKKTTKELISSQEVLSDDDFSRVKQVAAGLSKLPIEYVDRPCTVKEIKRIVDKKVKEIKIKRKALGLNSDNPSQLLVSLDHSILVKQDSGRGERETLVDLALMMNEVKHENTDEVYVNWLILSQTNRTLDDLERLNNPMTQFPVKSDIFGSDALWQISDVVIVLMNPYKYNIERWGGKPYKDGIPGVPTRGRLFMHLLKLREGEPGILVMNEALKFNQIWEPVKEKEE